MRFYDRKKELKTLDNAVRQKGSAMVIISGRRRIGKTRLVDEFLSKNKALRIMIVPKEEKQVASDFSELFSEGFKPTFNTVREALEYFFAKSEKRILYIDEFPNLVEVSGAIPYELQRIWDVYKDKTNKVLILSGSYASMMEDIFTRQKAPLFNRASFKILLEPLKPEFVWQMQSEIGINEPVQKVMNYCVFGGVPFYYTILEKYKGKINIADLFSGTGQLREEGQDVLRQEFGRSYKKYFSAMEAIGAGVVSAGEIANKMGMQQTTLSKYIQTLQNDYKLIERRVPFGENPRRSKKGIYSIKDNLLSFWFSCVYGKIYPPGNEELNLFISRRFESLCTEFLVSWLSKKGEKVIRLGQWWGNVKTKNSDYVPREIDIVVETDKTIYIGECKWSKNKIGSDVLMHLKESATALKSAQPTIWVLFSKAGFDMAGSNDLLLFDPERITKTSYR